MGLFNIIISILIVSHPYFTKAMEAHIGQHISQATEMQTLSCCVGAKLVLPFQALITQTFLDRSILFLYRESACTSGFISRFGTIVSYFVRGDIFVTHPVEA